MLATVTSDGRPARAGWGPVSGGSPPAAAGGNLTSSPALYGPPSGARLRPGARRRLAAAGPRRRARRRAGAWLADFTVTSRTMPPAADARAKILASFWAI